MSRFIKNAENTINIIFSLGLRTCLIIICILVALFQTCTREPHDPLEYDSSTKRRNVFTSLVVDSAGDGFEITFMSRDSITIMDLKNLQCSKRITEIETAFPHDAKRHFGDIIQTDIMDFALYGENYVKNDPITVKSVYDRGQKKFKLHNNPESKLYGAESGVDFTSAEINYPKE